MVSRLISSCWLYADMEVTTSLVTDSVAAVKRRSNSSSRAACVLLCSCSRSNLSFSRSISFISSSRFLATSRLFCSLVQYSFNSISSAPILLCCSRNVRFISSRRGCTCAAIFSTIIWSSLPCCALTRSVSFSIRFIPSLILLISSRNSWISALLSGFSCEAVGAFGPILVNAISPSCAFSTAIPGPLSLVSCGFPYFCVSASAYDLREALWILRRRLGRASIPTLVYTLFKLFSSNISISRCCTSCTILLTFC